MWNKTLELNKGFTLLEVIIAIFIISVGVGGVASVVPRLLSSSTTNQNRLTAAYLAQEGVEIVRNIRDTNWLENHYGSTPIVWDDGFSPCTSANGGCEIDYLGLAAPVINHYSGTKLKINSTSGFYNYSSGNQTKFDRKIIVDKNLAGDILTITVNVSWSDRGKSYNFPVQEKLYKWY
jgi:prepilin-type N-terminal cleavage/methylation domain-containing protein